MFWLLRKSFLSYFWLAILAIVFFQAGLSSHFVCQSLAAIRPISGKPGQLAVRSFVDISELAEQRLAPSIVYDPVCDSFDS